MKMNECIRFQDFLAWFRLIEDAETLFQASQVIKIYYYATFIFLEYYYDSEFLLCINSNNF